MTQRQLTTFTAHFSYVIIIWKLEHREHFYGTLNQYLLKFLLIVGRISLMMKQLGFIWG